MIAIKRKQNVWKKFKRDKTWKGDGRYEFFER